MLAPAVPLHSDQNQLLIRIQIVGHTVNPLFNVFAQETKPTRSHAPHTDDSTSQQKVVLRSNSETKREREHHRSDLTSWKTLTVPSHDTAHIPDWARPSAQDIALPSSSSQIESIAPPQMPTNRGDAPPLSIFFLEKTEIRLSTYMVNHLKDRSNGI